MTDGKQDNSLITVSDILGASKPATRLIEAIERGVGNLLQPWQSRRIAEAEISNFENWNLALERSGLAPKRAELTLQDRAAVRIVAEDIRHQQNREAVAIQATAEFKQEDETVIESNPSAVDAEWIDRFWRLAQDVSNADMQAVWGRILARKTTGRGTYSARCLETISLLSREEVSLLERLATLLWSATVRGKQAFFIVHHVQQLNSKAETQEMQARLRSIVGDLHKEIFGPAGIALDSGSGWAQSAEIDTTDGLALFSIANKSFRLTFPNADTKTAYFGSSLGISPLGGEIFSLISVTPNENYIAALADSFRADEIELKPE